MSLINPIQGNVADAFLRFNDQSGNQLISLNKDGSISATSVAIGPTTTTLNPVGGPNPTLVLQGTGGTPLEIHSIYATGMDMYTHSNTGFRSPHIQMCRSRGTQSAPLAVNQGDDLFTLYCS